MPSKGRNPSQFRERLLSGEPLVGPFIKTRDQTQIEVLALSDLDLVVLDAEHAPFDRTTLDPCLFAARSGALPSLVRVSSAIPDQLLSALDMGATGVLVPHVRDVATAEMVARTAHFGPGGRGYAGSTRAAGFTTKPMVQHLADSAAQTTVVAQIEDLEAVEDVDAIAAVEGIDCLFIGRVDLTVALGAASVNDPAVDEAIDRICEAGRRHNRRIGLFLANTAEVSKWQERGISLFLIGSDHGFVLAGANALAHDFRAAATPEA